MKTILVFGNPLVEEDNLAVETAKELKIPGYGFKLCNSLSDVLSQKGDLIILDVVENLKKTTLIKDIDQIKPSKSLTAHDFDLGFNLKLMKTLGKIKEVKIIGIPQKGDKEKIKKDINFILEPSFS